MITVDNRLCDVCGTCAGVCPVDAIVIEKQRIYILPKICINCLACVYVCPVEALSEDGVEQ